MRESNLENEEGMRGEASIPTSEMSEQATCTGSREISKHGIVH
jgi:hypothetical protein